MGDAKIRQLYSQIYPNSGSEAITISSINAPVKVNPGVGGGGRSPSGL